MPVGRADAELPDAPRFGYRLGNYFGPTRRHLFVKLVQALDEQIRDVRMVAQLAGGLFVRAFAEHQLEGVPRQEAPPIRTVAEVALKPEHINVETRGFAQIANGEYATGIDDAGHARFLQLPLCQVIAGPRAGWREKP